MIIRTFLSSLYSGMANKFFHLSPASMVISYGFMLYWYKNTVVASFLHVYILEEY